MRPKRMGTKGSKRVLLASSNRLIGSGRSGSGDHAAWLERGVLLRKALPAAERSAREVKLRSHPPDAVDRVVVVVMRFHLLPLGLFGSLMIFTSARDDGPNRPYHRS